MRKDVLHKRTAQVGNQTKNSPTNLESLGTATPSFSTVAIHLIITTLVKEAKRSADRPWESLRCCTSDPHTQRATTDYIREAQCPSSMRIEIAGPKAKAEI